MKYKGWIIKPVYSLCADWKLNKHGTVIPKKITSNDIEYYEILDPFENNKRWIAENTIKECKETINKFHTKVGWKKNQK